MEDCIFCKIVKGEIPSFKVYEDHQVLAFADINPISPGHTLIIPKNHAANLMEISEEDLMAVHRASKKVMGGDGGGLETNGRRLRSAQWSGGKSGGAALPPSPDPESPRGAGPFRFQHGKLNRGIWMISRPLPKK